MHLVDEWSQIRENLHTLNSYHRSSDPIERQFFADRIRLGRCFVALETPTGLIFGPSRFLGYARNDIQRHEANASKHGWDTNSAINAILGQCKASKTLEKQYLRFCAYSGIGPANKPRKYWLVTQVEDGISAR